MDICERFTADRCVNGQCPIANRDEHAELGIDVIESCSACAVLKGCEICIFQGVRDVCSIA